MQKQGMKRTALVALLGVALVAVTAIVVPRIISADLAARNPVEYPTYAPAFAQAGPTPVPPDSDSKLAYDAFVAHLYETKGDSYFWSLEDNAEAERLSQAAGNPALLTFEHGLPGEGDIPEEEAIRIAREAVMERYALKEETMELFEPKLMFNVANPDRAEWRVYFYPIDMEMFAELSMYGAFLYAGTGEVFHTESAADANG